MTGYILDNILRLAHPFMPFISEFLWSEERTDEQILMAQDWPQTHASLSADDEEEMDWLRGQIRAIRSHRAQLRTSAGAILDAYIAEKYDYTTRSPGLALGASEGSVESLSEADELGKRFERHRQAIEGLARIVCHIGKYPPNQAEAVRVHKGRVRTYLHLGGMIDFALERKRLKRKLDKVKSEIKQLEDRINSESFKNKSPPDVFESTLIRRDEKRGVRDDLLEVIASLPAQ